MLPWCGCRDYHLLLGMGANKFFFFPTQISLSLALSTNLKSKTNITSKYLSLFHVLFSSLALASQILLIMIEYHMHFLFLFLSFLNHTFPPPETGLLIPAQCWSAALGRVGLMPPVPGTVGRNKLLRSSSKCKVERSRFRIIKKSFSISCLLPFVSFQCWGFPHALPSPYIYPA